jgi:hypothetical protein
MTAATASAALPAPVERARVQAIFAGLPTIVGFARARTLAEHDGVPPERIAAVVDDLLRRLARELAGDRP